MKNEDIKMEEELKEQTSSAQQETEQTEPASDAQENSSENEENAEETPRELTVEERLAEAEAMIEQLKKDALYKVAEFENYRKRVIKEKADLISMGGKGLMLALLPVVDDLDRAEEHIAKSEDVEALKEGVLMISQKLRSTLQQQGLEKIEAKGEKFDTDLHEAVTMFPVQDEAQKGSVIDCVQQGYKMNGNVIRHAKVVVGQ